MTTLHRIPEERISAVLGVPAIVAGLGAGLENATYSNARELREMFTEQKLIPLWRADAAKLNTSLLPDFTRTRNAFIEFDITNVRALQEDENEKYTRLALAVGNKPWLTVNEARTEIGYDLSRAAMTWRSLSLSRSPSRSSSKKNSQPKSRRRKSWKRRRAVRRYDWPSCAAGGGCVAKEMRANDRYRLLGNPKP